MRLTSVISVLSLLGFLCLVNPEHVKEVAGILFRWLSPWPSVEILQNLLLCFVRNLQQYSLGQTCWRVYSDWSTHGVLLLEIPLLLYKLPKRVDGAFPILCADESLSCFDYKLTAYN